MSLIRKTGALGYLRPPGGAVLRERKTALQALNAKHAFGREANCLREPEMKGPHGQARPRGQLFDSITTLERQARGAVRSGPGPLEKLAPSAPAPA